MTSSTSQEPTRWSWCACSRETLTKTRCQVCREPLYAGLPTIIEYQGSHWHLPCLLNHLTG